MDTEAKLSSSSAAGGSKIDKAAGDSGSSKKVNAIWEQLKSTQGGPKVQGVNFNKLWHGFSSDKTQGKAKPASRPANEHSSYQAQVIDRSPPCSTSSPIAQRSPLSSGVAAPSTAYVKPDADTALQLVARCVAGLKDSSQAARRKALQDVQVGLDDERMSN